MRAFHTEKGKTMSNLQRHKYCTMRSELGNCLAMGGFCTSVSKEICEALQNAYTNGKHSVEVSEGSRKRGEIMRLINADELITAFPSGESVRTESVRATINHIPTIEVSEDCISRKWLKENAKVLGDYYENTVWAVPLSILEDAPSVVPSRAEEEHCCLTCKHKNKEWDSEECDGCTKANSNWERIEE